MTQERLKLLAWVHEVRAVDMWDVKKEVQRNNWLVEFLEKELHSVGLHTTTEFRNNKFSIFGKSRPDLAFYKESTSWIKAGIIMQEDNWLCVGLQLSSKWVFFKIMKIFCHKLLRIWCEFQLILLNDLKTGKIIDTVTVYGLLVAHNKHVAIPLMYYVDFTTNGCKHVR